MALVGTYLTLLVGSTTPIPAPNLINHLERVEVTCNDEGNSAFQLMFKAGRGQPFNFVDYPLFKDSALRVFSRVILMFTFRAHPTVLIDGIITDLQPVVNHKPGESTLTVTGEDIGVMMDLVHKNKGYPAQSDDIIARTIIADYAQYGLTPLVISPPVSARPRKQERTSIQHNTDLGYLREMAARYAYKFYITPGPTPTSNVAYWGPPTPQGPPQSALTVNMGANTNVEVINLNYDGLASEETEWRVKDGQTGQATRLSTVTDTNRMPLSQQTAFQSQAKHRRRWLESGGGLTIAEAETRAQANTDTSVDNILTVNGTVDLERYGHILQVGRLVGLRGVGHTYDGNYYVKKVSHIIERGSYKQNFTLTRSGVGALTPAVIP